MIRMSAWPLAIPVPLEVFTSSLMSTGDTNNRPKWTCLGRGGCQPGRGVLLYDAKTQNFEL
jgi:hypothetical protein